ncbi:MAG: hypothetical protein M1151_07670 [Candidatus Thermoplasmatota archaeon]|nr:hypothetical protein [Candidatus Thermoplasmatota archaeon]
MDLGILLEALGITLLEVSEATAVGIAIYADLKNPMVFLFIALGLIVILLPTAVLGQLVEYLPVEYIRLLSATLLLYFGLRLVKSAHRSFKFQGEHKDSSVGHEELEKGLFATAFSVGLVEAFEAAIVLVALFPMSYTSTIVGLTAGILLVVVAAFSLRKQIRKVKQAIMKVAVSGLLLTFSAFWYAESVVSVSDIYLIPLFLIAFAGVYFASSRKSAVPPADPTSR